MAQAATIGKCCRFATIVLLLFNGILAVRRAIGTAVRDKLLAATYAPTFLLIFCPTFCEFGKSSHILVTSPSSSVSMWTSLPIAPLAKPSETSTFVVIMYILLRTNVISYGSPPVSIVDILCSFWRTNTSCFLLLQPT